MALTSNNVARKTKRRASRDLGTGADSSSENRLSQPAADRPDAWHRRPFFLGLAGCLLLLAAFPPLNLWPLAWLAPVPWIRLIRSAGMSGTLIYLQLWMVGVIYWLALFYFIPIPFWGLYLGWATMSAYLGVYFPLFVGLTRVAVHQLRIPVILSAPIVWTGLELARGHLFTGLSMSLLGHTQVEWVTMIQVADLAGAYAISFVIVWVAACIARMLPAEGAPVAYWPAVPGVLAIAGCMAYGQFRMNQPATKDEPGVRVALIQGSIDTVFDLKPQQAMRRQQRIFETYREWTAKAVAAHPDVDLIVWPESKFTVQDVIKSDAEAIPYELPDDGSALTNWKQIRDLSRLALSDESGLPARAFFLTGTQTLHVGESSTRHFNAALLIDPEGRVRNRYFKMHRVLFGEYIPLGNYLPWLYDLTPMGGELSAGSEPRAFSVKGLNFSPSVCFESTVPHLIRRQVEQLEDAGNSVDVLVNITDDGWFKGTACLDHHLACSVLRSVELRRPSVIAANTGFSAVVDGDGRLLQKSPRRQPAFLFAEIRPDTRQSVYQHIGDWPAGLCLAVTMLVAVAGVARHVGSRKMRS